ncbi:zf-HC2 domain-containing protein [Streptomyces sp. ISL-11]|nr:zf-HC2 domain-containing protein [Streptomyces sp. ISL-11]
MKHSTASASPPRAASAQAVTVSSSRTAASRTGGGARCSGGAGDDGGVHCPDFRTAISARVDGEELPPDLSGTALAAHLRGCADCRRWEERAYRLKKLTAGLF